MALGAVAALGQKNIKRLMAYSSIGHMGYALLGLAAGTALGVRGVLIYLAIYVFTNLGVFACIQAMRRGGKPVETIADLAGLARTNPKLALVFSMLFLSLAGLPPLAGFFAKFYVFLAAIQAGLDLARHSRRARERRGPGLLSAPGEGDVFRRSRARLRQRHGVGLARDPDRVAARWRCCSSLPRRRSSPPPTLPPRHCCLDQLAARLRPEAVRRNRFHQRGGAPSRRGGRGGPVWITAARQTAGRGRRGRAWESPGGNLAATLLLRPDRRPRRMGPAFLRHRHRRRRHGGGFAPRRADRAQMAQRCAGGRQKAGGHIAGNGQRPVARAGHRHRHQSGASSRRTPNFPRPRWRRWAQSVPSRRRCAGRARGRLRQMV